MDPHPRRASSDRSNRFLLLRDPSGPPPAKWSADKITVSNVLPIGETWGQKRMCRRRPNPLGCLGSPEEDIAPVVLFLGSKDSQFITGFSLTPDGGSIIDSAR